MLTLSTEPVQLLGKNCGHGWSVKEGLNISVQSRKKKRCRKNVGTDYTEFLEN